MKIILIDDDKLVLEALKTILNASGIEVAATGENGLRLTELYQAHQPDLVMLDIRMPQMDGLEAANLLLQIEPQAKILLLTTFQDEAYIAEALALGCKGYLLKQNFAAIIPAIQAIAAGNLVFDSEIMSQLSMIPEPKRDHRLSEREHEILLLIAEGLNNKEISAKLFLSEGTVRNHVSTMLDKLDLRDRTQLAVFYYKHLIL